MTDWTEGYVADIDYTFSYCQELNPHRVDLAFLGKGLVPPKMQTACELGYGQGLGTNIHAAASPVEWYGTDFNPSQASFAQELSAISGADAKLYEDAFEDFCHRTDLPDFDYIGMHGVWSWVSDHNRTVIVDFLRRKLKPGGVVYMGYNAAPGWASFVPMRDMMKRYAEMMVPQSFASVDRIDIAVDFAEKFMAVNPAYAGANPAVTDRLAKISGQDRHYLAHEYFCHDWHPMHFSVMTGMLAPAKVGFACSARYLDHIDGLNLGADQIAFLNEIPDPMFRESVRDVMIARRFRCDYWVKGARRVSVMEHSDLLRALRVVLLKRREDISLKVQGALMEVDMQAAIYDPVLDALADQKPKTIGEIEDLVRPSGLTLVHLIQAMLVLAGSGQLATTQDEATIAGVRDKTERLNAHLTSKARDSSEIAYLASPVTGGGVSVGRMQQLIVAAIGAGHDQPEGWVDHIWPILAAQGQMIVKDGKTLETDDENRAELLQQVKTFAETQLPVLKALRIC